MLARTVACRRVGALGAAAWARQLSTGAEGAVKVERMERNGNDIAVLKLNNAPVNSLDRGTINQVTQAIRDLEGDGVQGMILASDLRVFSAGLDINEMAGVSEAHFKAFWGDFESLWSTLYLSPMATVAAIEGSAPAGGSVLALSCDYRVVAAKDSIKLGLNETQIGLVCPRWLQAMCAQTVGSRASEWLLQTGAMMSPESALSYGFIDEVVPEGEVMDRSLKILDTLTSRPFTARSTTKLQQREHIAAMCGPSSSHELWGILSAPECTETLTRVLEALKNKKKK